MIASLRVVSGFYTKNPQPVDPLECHRTFFETEDRLGADMACGNRLVCTCARVCLCVCIFGVVYGFQCHPIIVCVCLCGGGGAFFLRKGGCGCACVTTTGISSGLRPGGGGQR